MKKIFKRKYLLFFFFVLDMFRGYLCFVVSIFCIGVVTAVIGDIASHFGATLGIKDAVTAIVFVALGTSIPGKFYCVFVISYIFFGTKLLITGYGGINAIEQNHHVTKKALKNLTSRPLWLHTRERSKSSLPMKVKIN